MTNTLPFRQVHLDFHTNGTIPGIGSRFDAAQWQEALKRGHVDSITLFARCHHGWCYYPTEIGSVHPHLDFDLLGAQIEASKAIGVKTPVYITVGWDELYAHAHPGDLVVPPGGYDPLHPAWKRIAFTDAYIDFVCRITEEIVSRYDTDGIFFDIVGLYDDVSPAAQVAMREQNLDPTSRTDREAYCRQRQEVYFQRANAAIHKHNPDLRIFHNAGHIPKGDRVFLKYASHLELESLPTGGWGYDHLPLSAKYAATQRGVDFLGMTGKFHTSWGEFGGFKHPNALRMECASMLAYGARCSIGDQLHPNGEMNPDTYDRIGQAYAHVEQCEPWCTGVEPVSEIGLLSVETLPRDEEAGEHFGGRNQLADVGASRMLLEEQLVFDVLDTEADFTNYTILILPDEVRLEGALLDKVQAFLDQGGKLLLTGDSGLKPGEDIYALQSIGNREASADFDKEYLQVRPDWAEAKASDTLVKTPFVIPGPNPRVRPDANATVLADLVEPYFNRTIEHFCSHQHAPDATTTPYAGAFMAGKQIAVIPAPLFTHYANVGMHLFREFFRQVFNTLSAEAPQISTSLPSAGRVSLMHQPDENRHILHLLYFTPHKRGGHALTEWGIRDIEVVEDVPVQHNVQVSVRIDNDVTQVQEVPGGETLPFDLKDGRLSFTVPVLDGHSMIEIS